MNEMAVALLTFVFTLFNLAEAWCDYDGECYYPYYVYTWWFWLVWVIVIGAIIAAIVCCVRRRQVFVGSVVSTPAPNVTSVTVAAPAQQAPPPYLRYEYDQPTGYWHPPPSAMPPSQPPKVY